ncbi:MAG: hypothetical protein WAX69_22735 [Victivallales bacterium]
MSLRIKGAALLAASMLALSMQFANAVAETFPPAGHVETIGKYWSIIGPFAVEGGDAAAAMAKEYPPEKLRNFCTRYQGEDGKMIYWSGCQEVNSRKIVPAAKGRAEKPGIFFAVSYIESQANGKASIAFQSDVPAKVWVNGSVAGELTPGASAVFSAEFKTGMNELLVKCVSEKTGGGFSAAISDTIKGLVFSGYIPWPLAPVPASAWRAAELASGDVEAVRAALLKKDEVGLIRQLQDKKEIAWSETKPATDGSSVISRKSPEDTLFLVSHIFSPMKFHAQEYKFKLSCPKGTSFYIDGRKLNGSYDEAAKVFSTKGFSHEMRVGLNRMVVEIPPSAGDASVQLVMSNPGDVKFMAEALPEMDTKIHVGDWPSTVITNGIVTATVAIPDLEKGYYRGNRFEQAGIITKLERDGHTFFLDAPAVHSPLNSGECCGPCEEWFEAIAYDDAKPGEPFIKLGVGLYEKPYHPNHLWYCTYWPIKMFGWTTKAEKDRIEFVQEADGPRGWSYRYVKKLILVPGRPVLLIEHTLTNTGKQRIDAEQYAHNFMSLDRKPVEKGLTVSFTFPPKTTADISKIGTIEGNKLVVTADKVETKFVPLEGWAPDARDVATTITTPGTAAGIRIGGDFIVSRMGVFLSEGQVSCEPFTKVSLEPGATATWIRNYEFLLDGAAGK